MITQWRQEVRVEEGSIQCTERERRRAWRVQAVAIVGCVGLVEQALLLTKRKHAR